MWSPIDLLDFYRQIPPEQVVYASDYPYGQQPASLLIAVKTAQLAGYTEAQVRAMLAGRVNRRSHNRFGSQRRAWCRSGRAFLVAVQRPLRPSEAQCWLGEPI